MQGKGIFNKRTIVQKFFLERNFSFGHNGKPKKPNRKDEKKPARKNSLKDALKQVMQPPPRAITPPEEPPAKKANKKSR